VTRNIWHSCGPDTVEAFLEGKGAKARALWEALVELVADLDPSEFVANRTGIGFMVRVRSAGVRSISDRGMTVGFWLKRRIESPRFTRVEHLERNDWIYTFRVRSPEELDDEVRGWLRESYDVGSQRHLYGPSPDRPK
jgi:hypothetical protein